MTGEIARDSSLQEQLFEAVKKSLQEKAEQEIEKKALEIKQKLKEEVGAIVISLLKYCEVRMLENRIVIEVKFEEKK